MVPLEERNCDEGSIYDSGPRSLCFNATHHPDPLKNKKQWIEDKMISTEPLPKFGFRETLLTRSRFVHVTPNN